MSIEHIDYIEERKAKIAYHVAETFADLIGSEDLQWELFGDFSDAIDKSNVFIVENFNYRTVYQKRIEGLLDKLENYFGYEVDAYVYSMFTVFADPFRVYKREDYQIISDKELERLRSLYLKHLDYYQNIGVWYNRFLDFMLDGGETYYEDMLAAVMDLNNEIGNYKKNREQEYKKEMFFSMFAITRYSRFFKKYNLKDSYDMFNLLTEVDSFTIDSKLLNEDELRQVEVNKSKYRERMGLKEDFNLNVNKANRLKKKIEKIYNDNVFNELFVKSNLGEFFKNLNIDNNAFNIIDMVVVYLNLEGTEALNFYHDFGNGLQNYSLYRKEIFNYEDTALINVIIHEFVHGLERVYDRGEKKHIFNDNYRDMNEVLTEFISRESTKRFMGLTEYNDSSSDERYNIEMLLVDQIKNSEFFKYLIISKLYNDDKWLAQKIERGNLDKICSYFEKVWNSDKLDDLNIDYIKRDLCEVVKKIDENYFNNNERKYKR